MLQVLSQASFRAIGQSQDDAGGTEFIYVAVYE